MNTAHLVLFIIRDRGTSSTRTSYATKAVLASPPGQRPAKGARGCADPDFATAPQSLRGAVLKRETERGQNRVSLDAVRDVEFMKPSAAESHLLRSLPERIA
jgi:hypothetical protein